MERAQTALAAAEKLLAEQRAAVAATEERVAQLRAELVAPRGQKRSATGVAVEAPTWVERPTSGLGDRVDVRC